MVETLRYAAFGEVPNGGNPAGVVLDARDLSAAQMLAIAADIGYSETAFLLPSHDHNRQYGIRYFSPRAEVAFCGHATIAAAVVLAERLGPGGLDFHTSVGPVAIQTASRADGRTTASFTSVPTTTRTATADEVGDALAALHWSSDDLDPRYPVHVANAGNDHLILAAASRHRLAHLEYDFERLGQLMADRRWTTVHLFWAESPTAFHARDPFPPGGVVEDPATGAAAAAFGGYLRDLGLVTAPASVVIHQGEDMGRPSVLVAGIDGDDRRVRVTGTAVPIDCLESADPHRAELGKPGGVEQGDPPAAETLGEHR